MRRMIRNRTQRRLNKRKLTRDREDPSESEKERRWKSGSQSRSQRCEKNVADKSIEKGKGLSESDKKVRKIEEN